jgi:hypothetical protein
MRISDHRYNRDLRRHDLALRMVRHEARTQTIRMWTGLSDTRIRRLYRSYVPESGQSAPRHRGPAPSRLELLLRPEVSAEAAGLAGLYLVVGLLPQKPIVNASRELPSVGAGERLCYAFEFYQQMIPRPQISLDLAVLLVTALAERAEVSLGHCDRCDVAMLVNLLSKPSRLCSDCALDPEHGSIEELPRRRSEHGEPEEGSIADPLEGFQRSLF